MFVKRFYKRLARFYDRFSRHYGSDYRALNWVSPKSQEKRYKVIAACLAPACSLNDIGCGHGDLMAYLHQRDEQFVTSYVGYDVAKEILEHVPASLQSLVHVSFRHITDPFEMQLADYSVANGIFNNNWRTTLRKHHLAVFEEVVRAMWARSMHGIVFNVLIRQKREPYDGLFYFDQSYVEDFLKAEIHPSFQLIDGYDPDDRTFFVQKP